MYSMGTRRLQKTDDKLVKTDRQWGVWCAEDREGCGPSVVTRRISLISGDHVAEAETGRQDYRTFRHPTDSKWTRST